MWQMDGAKVVGRMPRHLHIVGVEPAELGYGEGCSAPVAASFELAGRLVLERIRAREVS